MKKHIKLLLLIMSFLPLLVYFSSAAGPYGTCTKCGADLDKAGGSVFCTNSECTDAPEKYTPEEYSKPDEKGTYQRLPNPFKFIQNGKEGSGALQEAVDDAMAPVAPTIYAILLKAGIAIALVVIIIWGVMWVTAAPAKRAELKASIMPIVVGLFILIAGIRPAILVAEFMQNIFVTDKNLVAQVDDGAGQIAGLIQAIGISIALIVVLVTGVQWVNANASKKAELKSKLLGILIGVAVIVTASVILGWLVEFFKGARW